VLIRVAGAGGHVGVLGDHPPPLVGVEILEVQPLAVRPVRQDDRERPVVRGTKDVGAQHEPVVHPDRHVPLDAHAVAHDPAGIAHRSVTSHAAGRWTAPGRGGEYRAAMAIRANEAVADRGGVVPIGARTQPRRASLTLRREARLAYALLTPTGLVILFLVAYPF